MKRYFKALGYLLSVHVLALLVMTIFRLVEFIALHGMIVDAGASRVMAFVKGVWFDNVIACYNLLAELKNRLKISIFLWRKKLCISLIFSNFVVSNYKVIYFALCTTCMQIS